ncbi:MAG: hypothetical protein SF052_04010, partial [Bacteroidia bacterium]|nr:hypothetical protein [Bacteroidia bacterium]
MRIFIQFIREFGRLFLLLFVGVVLCTHTSISQPYIDSVCVLTEYQPIGGHSLYLANLPGAPHERFVFDSLGGMIVFYSDSTANIVGRVVNDSLSNLQWDVNIWLENRRTFAQWKALQRKIKIELAPDSIAHANKFNWMFYELDSTRSRLTGVPGTFYAGDTLHLTHMPANYNFGFQMGVAANSKNGNYGISGWFFYGGSYCGEGDVNANLSCSVPVCDVAIDTVVTNCLSDSTFQAVVTLSGSGNNLSISDNQGTTPLTGLSAGTYNFGTYANNTSVTIFAADLNLIACADTAAPVTADCTPPPVCDVAIDTVVTNCLSDSTFQAVVTLSGSGNNLSISDNQGTTPLTGLSAGTYNFGTYANNTSVTIFAADLNLIACADTAAPVTADCTPPPVCDVAIDTVVTNCLSDSTFQAVVTLSGSGNNLSISDNQGTTPLTGL